MKILNKKEKEEIKSTFLGTIKSIIGELTAILFLGMLIILFSKFALGINGDDTFTDYKDESLDDHLSPFFEYSSFFYSLEDVITNYLTGAFLLWLVLAGINKLTEKHADTLPEKSIYEKILTKIFFVRVKLALFTLIYFIASLIFYFSYTASFF